MLNDTIKQEVIASVRSWCDHARLCIDAENELTATALLNQAYGAVTAAQLCGMDKETSEVLRYEVFKLSERIQGSR